MADRVCIRGCMIRGEHFAACPDFGKEDPVCTGCVPVEAADGAMACARCVRRIRRALDDAADVVGHLRSIADPTKAAVYDRVMVASSRPDIPAPVAADLVDASAGITVTLRDWAEHLTGEKSGYRLPPGAAADVAFDAVQGFAVTVLDRLDEIANTTDVAALGDALLTRHEEPAWWSVADALARWPLEDVRERWAKTVCPECDRRTVRVRPPRGAGRPASFRCTECRWERDDSDTDGPWVELFLGDEDPKQTDTFVLPVCAECVAGDHARDVGEHGDECECRCNTNRAVLTGDEMDGWVTPAEAAVRVGRTERTIRRWGLRILLGKVQLDELIEKDKTMRGRVGRPKKGA